MARSEIVSALASTRRANEANRPSAPAPNAATFPRRAIRRIEATRAAASRRGLGALHSAEHPGSPADARGPSLARIRSSPARRSSRPVTTAPSRHQPHGDHRITVRQQPSGRGTIHRTLRNSRSSLRRLARRLMTLSVARRRAGHKLLNLAPRSSRAVQSRHGQSHCAEVPVVRLVLSKRGLRHEQGPPDLFVLQGAHDLGCAGGCFSERGQSA